MSDEKKQSNGLEEAISAAEKVKGAAKTGKAIANIVKGAATGGAAGAALEAANAFKKELMIVAVVVIIVPCLFILMLPQVIFGGLFNTTDDIMNNNQQIVDNIADINNQVAAVLTEGYENTLDTVARLANDLEYVEIIDTVGGDIAFDANKVICWFSAAKVQDVAEISISSLIQKVAGHKNQLYYYERTTERRRVTKYDDEGEPYTETVTFTIFTVKYRGDQYFPDTVFSLTPEQLTLADEYAVNLTIFLYDSYNVEANGTHSSIWDLIKDDVTPLEDAQFGNPFPGTDWRDRISSLFGNRPYPGVGTGTDNHTGLDLKYGEGTTIHAVGSGSVLFVRNSGDSGYGKHVAINHGGGYVTLYAHCSSILVSPGQRVEKGDAIAKVGSTGWSTGPHLHIEVIIDGVPVDPLQYISNN